MSAMTFYYIQEQGLVKLKVASSLRSTLQLQDVPGLDSSRNFIIQ